MFAEFEFKPNGNIFNDFENDEKEFLKSLIVENMKETSKKPEKMPRKLYHATYQKNLKSILEEGLKPHPIFGEIYFCEKERQVLSFMDRNLPIIVFCIDASKLDQNEIYLSSDHKKIKGRNFDAYSYYGHISPELCKTWRRI